MVFVTSRLSLDKRCISLGHVDYYTISFLFFIGLGAVSEDRLRSKRSPSALLTDANLDSTMVDFLGAKFVYGRA